MIRTELALGELRLIVDAREVLTIDMIVAVLNAFRNLDEVTPIARAECNDHYGTGAATYNMLVVARDGREWSQTMGFVDDLDVNPSFTLSVVDPWFRNEALLVADFRLTLVKLRATHPFALFELTNTP